MTTRSIRTPDDLESLFTFLSSRKMPFTVNVASGALRSTQQNRTQRLWMIEISEQLGDMTPEEVRGYCKLTIGVPILRAENEAFQQKYDAVVRPLPYEQKLAFMMEPLDLPITRLMTTKQKTEYLDGVLRHFSQQGIILTEPGPTAGSRDTRPVSLNHAGGDSSRQRAALEV